jgi:hypothetical protein
MRTLGKRSISSVFKKIITIIFYLEFLLLLTPPLVFLDDGGIRYRTPITLDSLTVKPVITTESKKITAFAIHERYDVRDEKLEKTLSFEDSTPGRRWLQTLHNVVTIAIILLITYWLKKLFTNLAENKPFRDENSKQVRWIAWTVLFMVFFDVVKAFLYRAYTASTISLSGASLDRYDYSFDVRAFLLGLLLLIIAELFRIGNQYQMDSESIL